MYTDKYSYFVCPICSSDLEFNCKSYSPEGVVMSGNLKCKKCNVIYPIINSIARFVDNQNYAAWFGRQWELHSKTQIDKFNGTTISKDRFYRETRWNQSELYGRKVLECGSGAGRFTQVVLDAGAICFSFDYSNAVEVNWRNNFPNNNLILTQADIYHIPFKKKYLIIYFALEYFNIHPILERLSSVWFLT